MKDNNGEKSNFFKFEDNNLDFPFYKDNPKLSIGLWFVLAIIIIAEIILAFNSNLLDIQFRRVLDFLIPFIGFGIVASWKFNLIFKKPHKKDITLIIKLLILQIIFSIVLDILLSSGLQITAQANPAANDLGSLVFWIIFPLKILGEELFKIILFLILLYGVYKYTDNRKLSIIIATTFTLIVFGLIHFPVYKSIISVLVLQGFVFIFPMIGYLKTKNILIPFLIHLLFNLFFVCIPFLITILLALV